jgi:hypothetical protein
MANRAPTRNSVPVTYIVGGTLIVGALVAGALYLHRPAAEPTQNSPASPEARAYLSKLALSDVRMKASENFMKQQLVEIEGQITNNGPRELRSVDVYCLFRGVDGHEVYRERAAIVGAKGAGVKSKETHPFRLAFDRLPEEWNQAMPTLVVAQITFGR